ncbi:MAG TPA: hypothetical protein VKT77_14560 [Chthonomonadaceae bacterium]|nr:hypothetical protein [Chthonomonadaceae bacterium]
MPAAIDPIRQVRASAVQVLCREIGVVNTLRFLNEMSPGSGDYTKERDQLFGHLTVDEISSEILEGKAKPTERR